MRILAALLLLMPALLAPQAQAEERPFYSIHVASFEDLHEAGKHVNDLRSTAKIVFWKESGTVGERMHYQVFLGKYESRERALAVGDRLSAEEKVGYLGVRRFDEPLLISPQPPETPNFRKMPVAVPPATRNRFLDHGNGTVTDTATGLMWVKNGWTREFLGAVTWQEAIRKCEALGLGKYTNWRLPTIDEWKTLIDRTRQCPALVEPNPFNNMIVHMPYWSRTEFVYGPDYTCNEVCPIKAYTVNLYYGHVQNMNKNERAFILPVRKIP